MAGGERILCLLDEIPDPGSLGFGRASESGRAELFVVRRGRQVYGYRDRCPHAGAPLAWLPDRYLDPEGAYIQCSVHGALFRPEDGRCVRGPCSGRGLEPVRVQVCGERVVLSP